MEFSQSSDDSNSEVMDSPEDPLTTKLHVFENTSIEEDTSILDYCTNTTIQARYFTIAVGTYGTSRSQFYLNFLRVIFDNGKRARDSVLIMNSFM